MQAPFAQESHRLMRILLVFTNNGHKPIRVYVLRHVIDMFVYIYQNFCHPEWQGRIATLWPL